jgi:hypothetical protein
MKMFPVFLFAVLLNCALCAEDDNVEVQQAVGKANNQAKRQALLNTKEATNDISPSATRTFSMEPTRLRWPGGKKTLQETVVWLSSAGNETSLCPSLFEKRGVSLELPFLEGTYWEAVQAVCRTYRLGIRAPKKFTRCYYANRSGGLSQILQAEGGPVVLALRPGAVLPGTEQKNTTSATKAVDINELRSNPTALRVFLSKQMSATRTVSSRNDATFFPEALTIPSGLATILVEDAGIFSMAAMERSAVLGRIDYRLRLEPRIPLQTLGPGLLSWNQAQTSSGRALFLANNDNGYSFRSLDDLLNTYGYSNEISEHGRNDANMLLLQGVSKLDRGFSFAGSYEFAQLESLERAWQMKSGDERALEGDTKKITVSYVDAGEGKTVAQSASRWAIQVKFSRGDGWVGHPRLTVRDAKGENVNSGTSTNSDGTNVTMVMGLQNGNPVQASIKCARVINRQSLPIGFSLLLP